MATGPLHESRPRSSIGKWFESLTGNDKRREAEEEERRKLRAEQLKKKIAAEIKQKMIEIDQRVVHFPTETTIRLRGQQSIIYGYRILKGGLIELAITRLSEGKSQMYVQVALADLGQDFLNFLNKNF